MRLRKLNVNGFGIVFSLYPNGVRTFDEGSFEELDTAAISGIPCIIDESSVPALAYDPDADIFQKIQLRENTEYEFSIDLPLDKVAYLNECENDPLYPFTNKSLNNLIKFNGPDSCFERPDGGYRVTGRFNYKEHAGTSYLDVQSGPDSILHIPVEVLTRKLDYSDEFQELLHQISDYSALLAMRLDNPTEASVMTNHKSSPSRLTEILAFRRLFRHNRLVACVNQIISNPSKKTISVITKEVSAFTVNPDWETLAHATADYDFHKDGVLSKYFRGYTPSNLPNRNVETTVDTVDNRFIKASLLFLSNRLAKLQEDLPKKYHASGRIMMQWREQLESLRSHVFWRQIGSGGSQPNSMVIGQRRGYREFMTLYTSFGLGIRLGTDTSLLSVGGDIKPVHLLYEMWCYLMIHDVLCDLCGSKGEPKLDFTKTSNLFSQTLSDNVAQQICFTYRDSTHSVKLILFYNKDFKPLKDTAALWSDSYSGVFHPDISLLMIVGDNEHWLHFDAKYRLDFSQLTSQIDDDDSASEFKRHDLHKMHTYRDAVLGTRGSYILFPGREKKGKVFVRNPLKSYRDRRLVPGIGAFALKPTNNELQTHQKESIQTHIQLCIQSILEDGGRYAEEQGLV